MDGYGFPKPIVAAVGVDVAPINPSPLDDEFNGSLLDPKWTWVNLGTTTFNFGQGMISFTPTLSATTNLVLLAQPAPLTPWTMTAKIAGHALFTSVVTAFGVFVRDSGGGKVTEIAFGQNTGWKLFVNKFNSTTSFSSAPFSGTNSTNIVQQMYLRIVDDGTNVAFSYSIDGRNFIVLFSEARTTFLPALNQIGIVSDHASASVPAVTSCDWFRVTQP